MPSESRVAPSAEALPAASVGAPSGPPSAGLKEALPTAAPLARRGLEELASPAVIHVDLDAVAHNVDVLRGLAAAHTGTDTLWGSVEHRRYST